MPTATHRRCCPRWRPFAVSHSGTATFVIYGRSAERRSGRGVATDQNDRQHDRNDGPKHKSLVRDAFLSIRNSALHGINRQPMFQSQKPRHHCFSSFIFTRLPLSSKVLITEVISSWVISPQGRGYYAVFELIAKRTNKALLDALSSTTASRVAWSVNIRSL